MVEREPAVEELGQVYDELFQQGAYELHRRQFEMLKRGKAPPNFHRRRVLQRIERMCEGRTLLEIGGGTGSFGALAASRGWQYADYDVSSFAVDCVRALSLDAHLFRAEDLPPLPPQSADAVVMWEVIEHVWNVRGYLEVIRDALRSKGVLALSTPNYARRPYQAALFGNGRFPSKPPVHLNFFTVESLEKMLRSCGFVTITVGKRRITAPALTLHSVLDHLKVALFLEEPLTLVAIARRA